MRPEFDLQKRLTIDLDEKEQSLEAQLETMHLAYQIDYINKIAACDGDMAKFLRTYGNCCAKVAVEQYKDKLNVIQNHLLRLAGADYVDLYLKEREKALLIYGLIKQSDNIPYLKHTLEKIFGFKLDAALVLDVSKSLCEYDANLVSAYARLLIEYLSCDQGLTRLKPLINQKILSNNALMVDATFNFFKSRHAEKINQLSYQLDLNGRSNDRQCKAIIAFFIALEQGSSVRVKDQMIRLIDKVYREGNEQLQAAHDEVCLAYTYTLMLPTVNESLFRINYSAL